MPSAEPTTPATDRRRPEPGGFTLLELVLALTIFALIVVNVLADREKSIHIAGDARVLQTVRYLAQSKIDEIRHDPSQYGESDTGDFSDLDTEHQNFSAYTWELEIQRMVAVGQGDSTDDDYLFEEDEDAVADVNEAGEALPARYVRRLTLVVGFEVDGYPKPDLSIKIVTFIPDEEEEPL